MAQQNYYELLGVNRDANEQDIKTAFKKLARQYHPDLNPGNAEASSKFKDINEANEVLTNPQKRKEYDMELSGPRPGPGGMGGMGGMFTDIFANVFNAFAGGNAGPRPNPGPQASGVAPLVVPVKITFEESIRGVLKKIPITKVMACQGCGGTGAKPGTPSGPCPKCHGQGKIQMHQQTPLGISVITKVCDRCNGKGRIIVDPCPRCYGTGMVKGSTAMDLNIPKGVTTGQSFTVKAGGNMSTTPGIPKGDLIIKIEVEPHKYYTRENNDLHLELPVPFSVALMGGKVNVPTIEGPMSFDVPEGTTTGKVLKVKGKGVQSKTGIGDLYIKVVIDVPKLSGKAKDSAQNLISMIDESDYKTVKQFNADMASMLKPAQ